MVSDKWIDCDPSIETFFVYSEDTERKAVKLNLFESPVATVAIIWLTQQREKEK